ncbi:hypothetical protein R3P38DRAFT_3206436 [Favolaschia claudopus]|uniref:Uncharacterized protein n=1 Tax=Favolaschia claudopus TaxID=2862362 RepID=A0AAW0AMX3_9AGAR
MNHATFNPFFATPSRSLKRSCDHLEESDPRPSKFAKRPVRLRLKTLLRLKQQEERWGSKSSKASAAVDPTPVVIPPIFRRHPSEAFFDVVRGKYAYPYSHTVDGQDTDMALADVPSEFQYSEVVYEDAEMEDIQKIEACPHIDELALALSALDISYDVPDLVHDMDGLDLSSGLADGDHIVADDDRNASLTSRAVSVPMVNASRHKAKAAKNDKENLAPHGEVAASSSGSKKKAAYANVNFIDFQERPALQSVIIKAPPMASPPYDYCQYFTTAVSAICGAVAISVSYLSFIEQIKDISIRIAFGFPFLAYNLHTSRNFFLSLVLHLIDHILSSIVYIHAAWTTTPTSLAAFAQLLDLLERIWKKLAAENREYTGHSAATFLSIEWASFARMLDTISARIGNMGCDTPSLSFLFRLGLPILPPPPAPTLSTAGLDLTGGAAWIRFGLACLRIRFYYQQSYSLAPRLHTLLSLVPPQPYLAVGLYLTGGAVSVLLRCVSTFHSMFANASLPNVHGLCASFPDSMTFMAHHLHRRSLSHCLSRALNSSLRSLAVGLSLLDDYSLMSVLSYRSLLPTRPRASPSYTPASMHLDARSQFRLSLCQRSLAHTRSILLVLYFGFVEIKPIIFATAMALSVFDIHELLHLSLLSECCASSS